LTAKSALEHRWISQSVDKATPKVDVSILVGLQSWVAAPRLLRACMSMMAWSLTNKQHAQVRGYFLALDRNHDGVISIEDLQQALKQVQDDGNASVELSQALQTAAAEFQEFQIHYSDFLAAMTGSHIELDEDLLHLTFQKFDRRGAGQISRQDLREVLGTNSDVDCLLEEAGLARNSGLQFSDFASYVRSGREALGKPKPQQEKFEGLQVAQELQLPKPLAAEKSCNQKTVEIPPRLRLSEAAYPKGQGSLDLRVSQFDAPSPVRAELKPCCCVQ